MTLPRTSPQKRKRTKKSAKSVARQDANRPDFGMPLDISRWDALKGELVRDVSSSQSVASVLGDAAADGAIYRWGLAIAMQGPLTVLQHRLSELAICDDGASVGEIAGGDRQWLAEEAGRFNASIFRDAMSGIDASEAVMWAAAMPALSEILPAETWWQCGEQLLQLRADASLRSDPTSPLHLLLAGELGLTLAWRLAALPSCAKIASTSLEAVSMFLRGEGESIDRSLIHPHELRLIVASLARCERLVGALEKRTEGPFNEREREIAAEFATWMAVLTRHDGTQVFSAADAASCHEDFQGGDDAETASPKKDKTQQPGLRGLMDAASAFDPETLGPAIAAALGESHSGGRLAWEVTLPETMWHSETSGIVAMLPEWDVRRGRTFLNDSGTDIEVDVTAGRRSLLQGTHQTMIHVDGVLQQPTGKWECTCEYSDDDVHLIEYEQSFSGGVVLQRQWMLVRDDRCVMVSDAVLPSSPRDPANAGHRVIDEREIRCVSRLPLAPNIGVMEDDHTRELILSDGKKSRALVMPLAANEWKVGPSACDVFLSDDRHLVVTSTGHGALYSPLWLDFQTRRFRRKRTWRQLTVAEDLAIIPSQIAAAFRIQVGSEHWFLYRSMSGRGPRSIMGKHLIADFFAARFHPGDGGMEELVTVDESE